MENKRKLRNFLVDSQAQFRLAFSFLILCMCSVGLIVYLFFSTSNLMAQQIDFSNTQMIALITQIKTKILVICTLGVLFLGTLCGLLWAMASHRIFGPMVQIHKQLDNFLSGDYQSKIKLRSHDEFHALAEKLNQIGDILQSKK